MIQTMNTYYIQLRGAVNEDSFNMKSPLQMKVIQVDSDAMLFAICADQSGLIGLIRYLHGQGYVLLSVNRAEDDPTISKEDLSHD
jgi:hypothetical protein